MEVARPLHDIVKSSGTGTTAPSSDSVTFNGSVWAVNSELYTEIEPGTYYYDIIYSNVAGNQIHYGWERFDANKTSTTNSSTIYIVSTQSAADRKEVRGTIVLSGDSQNNVLKYIKLRLLNQWTNSTLTGLTAESTIHYLSLRRKEDNPKTLSIKKNGVAESNVFTNFSSSSIRKDGNASFNNFYEL